jgi:hypothetical protein
MSAARRSRAPAVPGSITSSRASGCRRNRSQHQAAMASICDCASAVRTPRGAVGLRAGAPGSTAGAAASAASRGGRASKPHSSSARGSVPWRSLGTSALTLAAFISRQRAATICCAA